MATFRGMRQQFGDVCKVTLPGLSDPGAFISVLGPRAARDVLQPQASAKYLRGPVVLQKTIVAAAENSLFALQGQKWAVHRRLATPAFSIRHLRSLIGDFQLEADTLVQCVDKEMRRSGQVDMASFLTRATLDVISRSGFGRPFEMQRAFLQDKPGEFLALSKNIGE